MHAGPKEKGMKGRNKAIDFETLATNIPGIVYRVYLKGSKRMAFFNEMLQKMTGYEVSELKMGEVCSIDPIIISEDYSDPKIQPLMYLMLKSS